MSSNYSTLSKEAKIIIIKDLISEIQLKINKLINKRQAEQAETLEKLPLDTRVILNTIDLINSDITEQGKFDFNFILYSNSHEGLADVNFLFKNVDYKISLDNSNQRMDVHISGKYSMDYLLDSVNKQTLLYGEKIDTHITDDYFSIDFILSDDKVKFKIKGFEETMEKNIDSTLKLMVYAGGINKDEVKKYKKLLINFAEEDLLNKWIEFEKQGGYEKFFHKTNPSELKEAYLANQYLSFTGGCQKSYVSKDSCLYSTKIDYNKLENFLISIFEKQNKKITINENTRSFIKILKDNLLFKLSVSVNNKEQINGEILDFNLAVDQDNIALEFAPKDIKAKIDKTKVKIILDIKSKNNIEYIPNIRKIKAVHIDVLKDIFASKKEKILSEK